MSKYMTHKDRMGERPRPWRDKETLESAYRDTSKTVQEIADEFGCSPETVMRWVNKFGIEKREKYGGPWTDRGTLMDLYWNERLSQAEIADRLGCNQGTISDWFNRHDIPARHLSKPEGSLSTTEGGYVYYNGVDNTVWVHQLVAIADGHDPHKVFSDDYNIHHKNGIPFDNRPVNIDVLTVADHTDEHRELLVANREYHNPVIDENLCSQLREEYGPDTSMAELAGKYDVGQTSVRYHIRGECGCSR